MELGSLWSCNVLNLALPPQRLRPDTRPEQPGPVSQFFFLFRRKVRKKNENNNNNNKNIKIKKEINKRATKPINKSTNNKLN